MDPAIPDRSAYDFVLRRNDVSPDDTHAIHFSMYDEAVDSVVVEIDGVRRHCLFVKNPTTADRARKLGWEDVTGAWDAKLARASGAASAAEASAKLAADVVAVVLARGSPVAPGMLARELGLDVAVVRSALDAAVGDGRLSRRGSGAVVVYAASVAA